MTHYLVRQLHLVLSPVVLVSRLALAQLLPADFESLRSPASFDAVATGGAAAEIVQGHNENCHTRCVIAKATAS